MEPVGLWESCTPGDPRICCLTTAVNGKRSDHHNVAGSKDERSEDAASER
jgi:hypothetical protein